MMRWLILVVIILASTSVYAGNLYAELQYSCNPSGAITVRNPDPNVFYNAIASLSATQQECSILVTFLRLTFVVYDCPISHNISLVLLKTQTVPDILTGDDGYYTLRCQQIPATGVHRMVTDLSWVTNLMNTTVEPSVVPVIFPEMELQDVDTRVERTKAHVTERLRWEIEVTEGYIVLPLNCTAYSGTGNYAINLITNGCSLDVNLVTYFDYDSDSTRHILVSHLFAFRFADSKRLEIVCLLLGCRDRSPDPTPCDFTCPGKRKRSAKMNQNENQDISAEEPESFNAEVKTSVIVLEPESLGLTAGASAVTSAVTSASVIFVPFMAWTLLQI